MKRVIIVILIICTFLVKFSHAEYREYLEQEDEAKIVLTYFEVTDANLDLSWKIINNTDHDIWTCESINRISPEFEIFLDKDAATLVIRRQFNLPKDENNIWEHPKRGLFVRLRPGQEKVESLSLDIPVKPNPVFSALYPDSEFATRLNLEIGFFDEDLPDLILEIVEIAEKLSCDIGLYSPIFDLNSMEIRRLFFGGVIIARAFYSDSLAYFRDSVILGGDEIKIPHMGPAGPVLSGEQILRLEIDNISIPYESRYPPLESE